MKSHIAVLADRSGALVPYGRLGLPGQQWPPPSIVQSVTSAPSRQPEWLSERALP
jgi:hypothetical protein